MSASVHSSINTYERDHFNKFQRHTPLSCRRQQCFSKVPGTTGTISFFSMCGIVKAPSHLTECRRTKGDEWEKCTKCTRIQRIQTEFPSNHAINNYCQLLSTNGKQRKNITCEGYRLFGSPLLVNCSRRRAKGCYNQIKRTNSEQWFDMVCD